MDDPLTPRQRLEETQFTSRRGHRIGRARRRRQLERLYWDFFINSAPSDLLNQLSGSIRDAPDGAVNSVISDVHTPEIMSGHIKEIAKKLGSDLVGIIALDPHRDVPPDCPEEARFAIVCVMSAKYDPETSLGVGGQVPVQNGLMVSFILCAFFRESGHFATMRTGSARALADLAVRAGLGSIDHRGRLRTAHHGTHVWVADVVYTDFPLAGRSQ